MCSSDLDGFAIRGMDAKRISARASVPPQPDRKDLRAMLDQKSRGFGGAPIEERAGGHICKSGEEQFARILPYPPPWKSLGAKTNHLPNIQGFGRQKALPAGPGTQKFGLEPPLPGGPKGELTITPSIGREPGFPVGDSEG